LEVGDEGPVPDTPQEIEEMLREGYRRMPPIEKLDRETMIAAFGWDPEVEGY
jgi:hypothetical protein